MLNERLHGTRQQTSILLHTAHSDTTTTYLPPGSPRKKTETFSHWVSNSQQQSRAAESIQRESRYFSHKTDFRFAKPSSFAIEPWWMIAFENVFGRVEKMCGVCLCACVDTTTTTSTTKTTSHRELSEWEPVVVNSVLARGSWAFNGQDACLLICNINAYADTMQDTTNV